MKTEMLDPVLNAFMFHHQEGLPLAFSMNAAQSLGLRVNLAAFACDAFAAGWTDEKLRNVLETACCDAGHPFNWDEFSGKLAQLYALAVGDGIDAGHPECWAIMKDRLRKGGAR